MGGNERFSCILSVCRYMPPRYIRMFEKDCTSVVSHHVARNNLLSYAPWWDAIGEQSFVCTPYLLILEYKLIEDLYCQAIVHTADLFISVTTATPRPWRLAITYTLWYMMFQPHIILTACMLLYSHESFIHANSTIHSVALCIYESFIHANNIIHSVMLCYFDTLVGATTYDYSLRSLPNYLL